MTNVTPETYKVVQLTVLVTKARHQGGLRTIVAYGNHGAVGRTLPLHLHPLLLPGR